jgi:c-di-GMP-binding flagellar brake protein YcgR
MFGLEIFSKLVDFNNKSNDDTLEIFFTEGNVIMQEKVKNLEDFLNVNTRINITLNRTDYPGVYDSRVEDIDKKHILISHPSDEGVPIPMLPGTKVKVEYVSNDGRFSFDSEVIGKHTEGSLSFIQISVPKTVGRNQLREFFRVPTNIRGSVKIFYAKVPDMSMKIPHKKVDCRVIDLSGGGGKLITEAYFEKGQVFGLDMSADIEDASDVRCTCIRSKRIADKSEVSFKFNVAKDSERNPIIKYVFKRQIELKQLLG